MSSKAIANALQLDRIQPGCYYLQVPAVGLRMLCGSPPDAIKHLRVQGFVSEQNLSGVICETGPNALLLGEQLIQAGEVANLAEFPVLHMLYKQGLGIPGHPAQKKFGRPRLVGASNALAAQAEYIKRGNYGLYLESEYDELQLPVAEKQLYLEMKRQFAYGRFAETGDLMDLVAFDQETLELAPGLILTRLGGNRFVVDFQGQRAELDLSLKRGERFAPSYRLPKVALPQARFAVVHVGNGDGWDPDRPCMGSLILYKNRKFLMDAGPFVAENIKALGLSAKDLEGVLVTHVHDDHFGGFFSLLKRNPELKIVATPRIFLSLLKKYAALTGTAESRLRAKLQFEPLIPGAWNRLKGLEVKALPSAHPIDTTLFLVRAKGPEGYRTYGHLTDIASRKVLEDFARSAPNPKAFEKFKDALLESYDQPLDLKKVDVGGGFVHGEPQDFAQDGSATLLFSHTSQPLDPAQIPFASQPEFGDAHILIP
ncbi:MAG: MBL fold metallo-hydrolase [bacterium]|nr:MBL fold metallo-hydrolase [bacterium]